MDAVSDVLVGRARQGEGMRSMLGASFGVHLVLIAAVFFMPGGWFGAKSAPEVIMTISLGGPVGPRDGGMTQMGGRPVQAIAEAKKVIEPVRPPAARAPEVIEPKKAAPKKAESKIVETAKTPSSRTPTKGEELRKGSAVSAASAARGQGFGLSSGGGGTGSFLDTANFCCPEYIALMVEQIRGNWASQQQVSGLVQVKYTIQRDGTITAIQVERSSGSGQLDFMATRALIATRRLAALPDGFNEPSLTVHLTFEYTR